MNLLNIFPLLRIGLKYLDEVFSSKVRLDYLRALKYLLLIIKIKKFYEKLKDLIGMNFK